MNLPDSHMNMGKNLCRLTPRIPYKEGILEVRRRNLDLKRTWCSFYKLKIYTFFCWNFPFEKKWERKRDKCLFRAIYYVRKSNSSVCFTQCQLTQMDRKINPDLKKLLRRIGKIYRKSWYHSQFTWALWMSQFCWHGT